MVYNIGTLMVHKCKFLTPLKLQNIKEFKIGLRSFLDFSVKNIVVGFIKMGNVLCPDLITDLPVDIIDNNLIKLPFLNLFLMKNVSLSIKTETFLATSCRVYLQGAIA